MKQKRMTSFLIAAAICAGMALGVLIQFSTPVDEVTTVAVWPGWLDEDY